MKIFIGEITDSSVSVRARIDIKKRMIGEMIIDISPGDDFFILSYDKLVKLGPGMHIVSED